MQIDFFDKQILDLKTEKGAGGYSKIIIGVDEVGRGALAGPVVAAAVYIDLNQWKGEVPDELKSVRDSKKLSPRSREQIFDVLKKRKEVCYSLGIVSEKVIDRINIFEATKKAMIKAIKSMAFRPDLILLDGNFTLPSPIKQISIIGGDGSVFSIALASIVAKVVRDRIMVDYHRKYPQYNFDQHKGYGTLRHRKALNVYGPCKIHRLSFQLGLLGKTDNI